MCAMRTNAVKENETVSMRPYAVTHVHHMYTLVQSTFRLKITAWNRHTQPLFLFEEMRSRYSASSSLIVAIVCDEEEEEEKRYYVRTYVTIVSATFIQKDPCDSG